MIHIIAFDIKIISVDFMTPRTFGLEKYSWAMTTQQESYNT